MWRSKSWRRPRRNVRPAALPTLPPSHTPTPQAQRHAAKIALAGECNGNAPTFARCPARLLFASVVAASCLSSAACSQSAPEAPPAEGDAAAATLEIPAGDANQLLEFIHQLVRSEPQGETEEEQLAEARQLARTVATAAQQVLTSKPTGEQEMEAHYFQLQAVDLLARLGEKDADKLQSKLISEALAHQNPEVAAVGMKFYVEAQLAQWPSLNSKQKQQLVDALLKHIQQRGAEPSHAQTVMVVADAMGNMGDYAIATSLLDGALPLFRQSSSPQLRGALPMLEGVARRLSLPGKELKLSGTLLGGGKLDWKQFAGKVVLVDFWASWCGPCRAELPNVLRMYEGYHEQGFDVIGICLDDDPAQAQAFIDKAKLPWGSLFSEDESRRGWGDPRAEEFGVNAIPMAILLNQEGKVVSMNARGRELQRLLGELLGEPSGIRPPAPAPSAGVATEP